MDVREFESLGAFATFLSRVTTLERTGDAIARGFVADAIAVGARMRIGDPTKFLPLKPETIARKATGNAPLLETGTLRESIHWAHESTRKTVVGSADPKSVYHEMGGTDPGRPPQRAFLTSTFLEKAEYYRGLYEMMLARTLGKAK